MCNTEFKTDSDYDIELHKFCFYVEERKQSKAKCTEQNVKRWPKNPDL